MLNSQSKPCANDFQSYHQMNYRRYPWMIRTQMIPTLLRRFVLSQWAMYEFASPGENYFVVHENKPIGEHIFL